MIIIIPDQQSYMLEILQQPFAQNALIAGTVVAIVAAVIGYFVVLRAQAFAAHALSHIGFAGATGAALVGVSSLVGTIGFTLLAALGMGALGKRLRGRDVEIGMILSFALGLGVLFLRLYTSAANEAVGVLFGSILSVTPGDVMITLAAGLSTVIVLAILFRPLLFISIDPAVAEARGVPVRFLSIIFMLLLAITVAEATQVVGVLLVFALIVVPAAAAEHLTRKPLSAIILSIVFGLGFTWGGLLLAFVGRYPVSFYIAELAAATYFIAVNASHAFQPHRLAPVEDPHQEIITEE